MTAVNVIKSWESEIAGTRNARTARSKYTVLVDDPITADLDAGLAVGIPRVDDPWSQEDYWLQAAEIQVKPLGPYVREVLVNYSTRDASDYPANAPAGGNGPGPMGSPGIGGGPGLILTGSWGQPSTPFDEDPDLSVDFETSTEPVDTDIWGNLIINTAGVQPANKPTVDVDNAVAVFTRNEPDFSLLKASLYNNTVNSDNWAGMPPGTVRLKVSAKRLKWGDGTFYWSVTYRLMFRNDGQGNDGKPIGWRLRMLNEGVEELMVTAGGMPYLKAITDPSGSPITKSLPLDASGRLLLDIPQGNAIAPLIWKYWELYRPMPFGPLALL